MIARAVFTILVAVFVAGGIIGGLIGHDMHSVPPKPATCTFDGGGSIQVGEMAKTSNGILWACTDGSILVEVTYP
jgi:hypothetical protein